MKYTPRYCDANRLQEQGYNMLNNFNAFPTYTFLYSPYSNLATAIPNPAPGNSSTKTGLMSFAKDKRSEEAIAGAGEVHLKDICCRLQVNHLKPTELSNCTMDH